MTILEQFKAKAKTLGRTIVLPEGYDERALMAAEIIIKEGIAKVIILNAPESAAARLPGAELINTRTDPRAAELADKYYELRRAKGMTPEEAAKAMEDPLYFGTMLVRLGLAHGCVAGAANTTADVLRACFRTIGTKAGVSTVSSFFIMVTDNKELGEDGVLLFADCAVVENPDAATLADIAISTAENARGLLGIEPKVALLSFSTKGSAASEGAQKIARAADIIREKAPGLSCDGELQADAAIIPQVGERKAPGSTVAGKANVLVFPDLNSGNIGYKLVERFAGAQAVGPILQGLARPVNDLSRGASYTDIVNTVAITCLQN